METPAFEFELLNNKYAQFDNYEDAKNYVYGNKENIDYALIGGVWFNAYSKIPFTSREKYNTFLNKFPEQVRPLVIYLIGNFHRSPSNK